MSVRQLPVVLPSDSINNGKAVDCVEVVNGASQNVVRNIVGIGDPSIGTNIQTVNSNGGASVSPILLPTSQLTASIINVTGDFTIVGQAGKSIKLYRLVLFVAAPTNITFDDDTSPLSGPIPLQTSGNLVLDISSSGDPWYESSAGNPLVIKNSNSVQMSGTAYYVAI